MTFAYRNFNNNIYECFMIIEDSHLLQMRWSAYVRKNKYARGISFQDRISCLKKYIDILLPVYINEK